MVCTYEGKIYHKVEEEKTLGFVRGGGTSGIISEEGVFLHHGSGWYPRTHISPMIHFEVTTFTPLGWEVVGQNELKERTVATDFTDIGNRVKTVWTSDIPFDSYSLVAGKYIVTEEVLPQPVSAGRPVSKSGGSIRIATYFSPSSQPLARLHIDAAKEFLTLFPQFLTPYPYKSFSIVENFFTTGYGMPSYTLLGRDVIMRKHIQEGGLGHEIMHCWWGNFVNVDEARGNWCEGLTTYCSNYYYLELKRTPADALNYRRINCAKFSAFINEDNDYPVRQFRGKQVEADSEVGYGKPSAMFHILRQMIGDGAFFSALQMVIQEKGGKKANWEDFQLAFENTSGLRLGWFFTQWLDRTGVPDLSLQDVRIKSVGTDKYQITFTIKQHTAIPFRLFLPVVVTTDKGNQESIIEIASLVEPKTIEINAGKVISIAIDPEYHIFRRLKDKELWPCLGATLGDKNLLVIYPTGGSTEENSLYKKVAERLSAAQKTIIKPDNKVSQEDLSNNSLFLLGTPQVNLVTAQLQHHPYFPPKADPPLADKPTNFTLLKDGFIVEQMTYQSPGQALLASFWNPYNDKKYLSIFLGLSSEALERPSRIIFFYRWDQYVVFEQGQMTRKGDFTPPFNLLEHRFEPQTLKDSGADGHRLKRIENIKRHYNYFASARLAGREPGTEGDKLAAEYIAQEFKKYGLITEIQPFDIKMQKLGKKNSFSLTLPDGKVKQFTLGRDLLPLNFSNNGQVSGSMVFANYGISAEELNYDDYKINRIDAEGKIVLIKSGLPETITAVQYASSLYKVTNAIQHGAKAVVIITKNLADESAIWM
ncbi:MAG: M1 family aminopeptidase, partial [Planctomycetota bacterium]|nr:M1 family aminopeptidase [Planctomycetota bacterium]